MPIKDESAIQENREVWENVLEMVRTGEMPPEAAKAAAARRRPRPRFRRIDTVLGEFDCTGPRNVGRVTIRRLNRAEYNNTIRDLVGVDFKPAADFPNDDVGYGFDNIGDVLSLSPLLLEKYLSAAESVLDQAIVIADPPKPTEERLGSLRASFGAGGPRRRGGNVPACGKGRISGAELHRRGRLHRSASRCTASSSATSRCAGRCRSTGPTSRSSS